MIILYLCVLFFLSSALYFCKCRIDKFTQQKRIDIVISRYAEDLSAWLPEIIKKYSYANFIIYNKGSAPYIMDECTVIQLENVGRCDHTYLYHIIENYTDLADLTIFLPGSCMMDEKKEKTLRTLNLAMNPSNDDSVFVGSLNQGDISIRDKFYQFFLDDWVASNKENSSVNSESILLKCPERPFGKWYDKNFPNINVNFIVFQGIFAVSKKDIMNRSIESYKNMISYVNTHSNPEAGHYIERSWIAIFNPVQISNLFIAN